ncbi:MAG TPA: hypothetical protein VMY37_02605 [Thermoguttaceae bacterium]|nr:hypothetical protein [Thermoguttaceae bacterium]
MNYFAHALPFLDDPYFAAGTGVPDWLSVADRGVRVRRKHAEPLAKDPDGVTASVARGVIQHIRDDARFHESRCFVELSIELAGRFREVLDEPSGYRPSFLGHLLGEVLLDASLIAEAPAKLEEYCRVLDSVDGRQVEEAVNRMATRPTDRLAGMISRFCGERILWDYLEDVRLLGRLNQVMRRVGFAELPDGFRDVLPEAREQVSRRTAELLDGIPVEALPRT